MKIFTPHLPEYATLLAQLKRRAQVDPQLAFQVSEILQQVEQRGDQALVEFAARFDGAHLELEQLQVSEEELTQATAQINPKLLEAIQASRANVAAFAEAGKPQSWTQKNVQGVSVGAHYHPLKRVGIYIPGGSAPLISTVIMSVEIARVAACEEIVVCTPPQQDGRINADLLAALQLCGASEIYRAGGAQAIAAMAYGTTTIAPVAKVFGPGNRFVVEAKRQLFGLVGVDTIPGPSEIFVIADEHANPAFIAADLLAQAEHGPDSVVVCASPSHALLKAVSNEVQTQAKQLPRQAQLLSVLENGLHLIEVRTLADAVNMANDFASEHLSLAVDNPHALLPELHSSGEIFLGSSSPVALGDYLAGPSHTLPTGGAGHAFSGLSITDFYRKTGLVDASQSSMEASAPYIASLARAEGLEAHARSAELRAES